MACFIILVVSGKIIASYVKVSPNAVREPPFALKLQSIDHWNW